VSGCRIAFERFERWAIGLRLQPRTRQYVSYCLAICDSLDGHAERAIERLEAISYSKARASMKFGVDLIMASALVTLDRDRELAIFHIERAHELLRTTTTVLLEATLRLRQGDTTRARLLYEESSTLPPAGLQTPGGPDLRVRSPDDAREGNRLLAALYEVESQTATDATYTELSILAARGRFPATRRDASRLLNGRHVASQGEVDEGDRGSLAPIVSGTIEAGE
jgi:hypothetical protein